MQPDSSQGLIPIGAGSEIIIEISDLNLRIKSKLLGVEQNQYFIGKVFEGDLVGDFGSEAIKEHPIVVAYRSKDVIYQFNTRILNMVSDPARLLFLEYPKEVEERGARKKRFDCNIPAQTMIGNEIVDVELIDFSKEGCQCIIEKRDAELDKKRYEQIVVDMKIDILVNSPVTNQALKLPGIIRNISKKGSISISTGGIVIKLGIVFDEIEMNPAVKQKIADFLDNIQKTPVTETMETTETTGYAEHEATGLNVPVEPDETAQPAEPVESAQPAEPVETAQPAEPDETAQPAEPDEPFGIEPTGSMGPSDFELSGFNESTGLTESAEANEPTEPAESEQSAEPAETAESEQLAETAESEQSAEPAESEQPTETAEPEQSAEPAESEQSAEPAESEQPAEPAESEQPAEPAESEQPAEPAESEQPAEPAESFGFEPMKPEEPSAFEPKKSKDK